MCGQVVAAEQEKGVDRGETLIILIALGLLGAAVYFALRARRGEKAALREVESRKKIEADLQKRSADLEQLNQDLQQFAFMASHDLQEPLRKIVMFGDRLVDDKALQASPVQIDYLNRMRSAAKRMSALLESLLRFSRVTRGGDQKEVVDLGPVVREVVEDLDARIVHTSAKIEISNLPTVWADRVQMRELFQNLIANALKYHKSDVKPEIKVWDVKRDEEFTEIYVRDNGIGFDEKYLDRIFKPFQRLNTREEYEGTGMGLAICQKIVEKHGGRITAQSQPEEGSTFIMTLPLARS